MPNVDVLTELADMREANRSYEANLQVAKQSAGQPEHHDQSDEGRVSVDVARGKR